MSINHYKVIRDGSVALLVSSGFGAGWSTWNRDYPELLFDPVIVRMVKDAEDASLSGMSGSWARFREAAKAYLESKYPDQYICTEGLNGLHIVWVKEGTKFFIDEYDGSESVTCLDDIHWITA